jgi:hypothetical protein
MRQLVFATLASCQLAVVPAQAQESTPPPAPAPAPAPAVSDDAAVWSIIERAWRAQREGNQRWIEELLSPDFVGWSNDSPAPRDKSSTRLWSAFNTRQSDLLEYELYPLAIQIHGDTAVAHYLYSSAVQEKGRAVETVDGRYTDVLVRTGDGWRFLTWHGGAQTD